MFGGDKDNTPGCTRSVNRGRCGIFEHRNGFDVVGIYEVEVGNFHVVYEDKRRCSSLSTKRTHRTAKLNGTLRAYSADAVGDGKAWRDALQGFGHVGDGTAGDGVFNVDVGHGTG